MIETSPQHNDALFQTTADPGARLLPRSGGLPGVHNRLSATDPATRELKFAPITSRRSSRDESVPASDADLEQKPAEDTTSDHAHQDERGELPNHSGAQAQARATESKPASVLSNLRDAESANVCALATVAPDDDSHPADPSPVHALRSLIESARSSVLATEQQIAAETSDAANSVATSSQRLADQQLSSTETAPRKLNRGLNRLTPKNDPLSQKLRRKLERIREKKGLIATDSSPSAASKKKSRRKSKSYVGRVAPSISHVEATAETETAKAPAAESKHVVRKAATATSEADRAERSDQRTKDTSVRRKAGPSSSVARPEKHSASEKRRSKSAQLPPARSFTAVSDDSSRSVKKSASSAKKTRAESSKKQRTTSAETTAEKRAARKRSAIAAVASTSNSSLAEAERVAEERAANERFTDEPRTSKFAQSHLEAEARSQTSDVVEPATANDSDIAGPMYVDLQQFTESRIDVTFLSCHQTDHHFSAPSPVTAPTKQSSRIAVDSRSAASQSVSADSTAAAEKQPLQKEDDVADQTPADDQLTDEMPADEAQHTWLDFDKLEIDDQRPHKLRAREEAKLLAKRVGAKLGSPKTASTKTQAIRNSSSKAASPQTAFVALEISTAKQLHLSEKRNSGVAAKDRSQSKSRKTAAGLAVLALTEPAPVPVEPYAEWFKRVVLRNRGMMLFTTFYLHWLVLLLLAVIIVHAPENPAALLITATFSNDEPPTEAFEVVTREPEPMPEEDFVPEPEPLTTERVAELEERELEIDDSFLDNLHPDGMHAASDQATQDSGGAVSDSENSANPHEYRDSSPVQAVREGSFSVWTDPPHPKPGESYRLIIQVKLPPHVKRYPITDLQGVVVGSDGYRKPIPGFMKGDLPILDGYVRLAVPIVSADKKVCDTVFIRSKLLRETQKLMVEFL